MTDAPAPVPAPRARPSIPAGMPAARRDVALNAVADNADGTVWNERNRLFVDTMFKNDHQPYCAATYSSTWEFVQRQNCEAVALLFYQGVRYPWRGSTNWTLHKS